MLISVVFNRYRGLPENLAVINLPKYGEVLEALF